LYNRSHYVYEKHKFTYKSRISFYPMLPIARVRCEKHRRVRSVIFWRSARRPCCCCYYYSDATVQGTLSSPVIVNRFFSLSFLNDIVSDILSKSFVLSVHRYSMITFCVN